MKTKFEINEKVLYKGEEKIVAGTIKNFSNNKISYKLDNGEIVNEVQLTAVSKKVATEADKLREQYEALYGKPVSNAKKNDLEWIKLKIKEKTDGGIDKTPWEVINSLEGDSLSDFILAKGLDIDPNDYQSADELKIAIAEELEIEITE